MNDPIVGACQHYLAMVEDENAKPRHVRRALDELRAVVFRAEPLTDDKVAELLAWGRVIVQQQFAEHEATLHLSAQQ